MTYFNTQCSTEIDANEFSWSTKGSKSGKPCDITALTVKKRIPGDSWKHLCIQHPSPAGKNMIRIFADEFHITKSGKSAGDAVIIDMEHDSARKLYEFLKGFYGQGGSQ